MGSLSIWHWAALIIVWAIWIIPLFTILGRVGVARGWAFVALFPPLGMVLLWVIAFMRWPIGSTPVQRPAA
jgi:hypothetical protein